MNHGLNNDFLYVAYKIECYFVDDLDKEKIISGTAFAVKNIRNELCLVTNRHCIDLDFKQKDSKYVNYKLSKVILHSKIKDARTKLPYQSKNWLVANIDEFIIPNDNNNDIACLIDVKVHKENISDDSTLDYWIPYSIIANEDNFTQLQICDFVAFPSYGPWYDKVRNAPILRTGTIASDPRFDYSWTGKDEGKCVAYEAFSYEGSSGCPVFAIQKGIKVMVNGSLMSGGFRELMLIGINAGHMETETTKQHSGISYFYKSSAILDLIDS